MDISPINHYIELSAEEKLKIIFNSLGNNVSEFIYYENNMQIILVHKKTTLEFVYIPGGQFTQGFTVDNQKAAELIYAPVNANYNEMRPVMEKCINSILVTRTPILEKHLLKNISESVAFVTYEQALLYANSIDMRIPSETEWEYIARAGEKTLFPFGDTLIQENELEKWMYMDYCDFSKCSANRIGIYGLFTGEWTSTDYKKNYGLKTSSEKCKVIRGGAAMFWPWQDQEWVWCMSAMRMPSYDLIDGTCGFRLIYDINKCNE